MPGHLATWPTMTTIIPAWFDHLEESFSEKGELKNLGPPVKIHVGLCILLKMLVKSQEDHWLEHIAWFQTRRDYRKHRRISRPFSVLSISFKVDIPTGKVGGSLLFERQRRKLPRGVWGHAPPKKILKSRFSEMLFSPFSRQCLGLKNNQN